MDTFSFDPTEGLHTSIEDGIPSAIDNNEKGYEQPRDIRVDPLLSIPEIESFDYEGAVKAGMSSTDILNNMQSLPEFNKDFNFAEARKAMSDDELMGVMAGDAEKSKVNLARSKAYHAGIDNDFTLGAIHAAAGVQAAIEDLKFWKSDEEHDETIADLQGFAKDLSRARNDKDFLSMFTLGDISAQVATLPMAAQSRIATGTIEAALGYASGRAEGTVGEAGTMAAISGTIGAGIAHFMRGMNGNVSKEVLHNLKSQHLTTDSAKSAFDTYKREWDKVVSVDVQRPSVNPFNSKDFSINPNNPNFYKINDADVGETAALVDFLKGPGAEFKQEASALSLKAEKSIRGIRQQRIDVVNDTLSAVNKGDIEGIGHSLQKGMDTISTDYRRLRDSIGIAKVDNSDISKVADEFTEDALSRLDEAIRPDVRELKDLIADNTVNSLMDAKVLLNSIIRKTGKKGKAKKFKLGEVKSAIDKRIKDSIGPNKYSEYKAMDRDYSMMVGVRDSKVNEAIQAATKGEITPEDALRHINRISGKQLFNDIDKLIGTDEATKLELLTMKDAFSNSKSSSWSGLGKQIDGKGFITPEGKALRDTIQKFSELFNIDDLVVDAINKGDLIQGGAKSDAASQIKGAFFRSMFLNLQKHIPFIEVGKRAESLSNVVDVLKSPQQLKKFIDKAENFSKPIAHREISRLIKELPLTPSPRAGGVVDLTKGKSNDVFKASVATHSIQEGVEDAFKDAMFSKLNHSEKNQVIDRAFELFDNKAFLSKMDKVGDSLVAGRVEANAKIVDAAIRGEAELMYKAIRKDAGLDPDAVDAEMFDSLIKYVMSKTLKDCE